MATHAREAKNGKVDAKFFVKLDPIIQILRAAIWSGMVAEERPVSIMLIADQESAKTEALKFFHGTRTLAYLSDLTSTGLKPFKADIVAGKLRHLALMDLVRLVSHGKGTSERTIQTLASLMEEGESSVSDGGGTADWGKFPKVGVLMGITTDYFRARAGHWRKTGFMTRFVPVSYKYTAATVNEIHNSIARGKGFSEPRPEILPAYPSVIELNTEYAEMLRLQAKLLGEKMSVHGFRYHRVLRALAKSCARMENTGSVKLRHVKQVEEWAQFFTLDHIEL